MLFHSLNGKAGAADREDAAAPLLLPLDGRSALLRQQEQGAAFPFRRSCKADTVFFPVIPGEGNGPTFRIAASAGLLHPEGGVFVKHALHQENWMDPVPHGLAGQGGGIGRVEGLHHMVDGDALLAHFLPGSIVAPFFRHPGDLPGIDGLAVGIGHRFENVILHNIGQSQAAEGLGHPLFPDQRLIGHRLRLTCIADAVHAGQGTLYKAVGRYDAVFSVPFAGHRAGVAVRFPYRRHTDAPVELTAVAHDAAHITAAGKGTLGPAAPDGRFGNTRDAAHIVSVGAPGRTVVLTIQHIAQLHAAHHAARGVFFAGYGAPVDAFLQNRPGLITEVKGLFPHFGDIILRVKVIFNGHGAGDAAHIQIPFYGSQVAAAPGLAQGGIVDELLRHVVPQIPLIHIPGVREGIQNQSGDHLELIPHGADVGGKRVAGSIHLIPQQIHLTAQPVYRAVQAILRPVKIVAQGIKLDGLPG